MRSVLGKLDVLVEEQQELIITRNKQAIVRVLLPIQGIKKRHKHADLRSLQAVSSISSSEALIRQDRDERCFSCWQDFR